MRGISTAIKIWPSGKKAKDKRSRRGWRLALKRKKDGK